MFLLQYTVVLFWLATITNGKSSNAIVGSETKQNLLYRPFLDDSKISRYAKWKFLWPRKLVLSTNKTVIPERSAAKDEDVSSLILGRFQLMKKKR